MPKEGYKQNPEHIARNRASRGPVVISDSQRAKISAALIGRRYKPLKVPPAPPQSPETAWAGGLFEAEGSICIDRSVTGRAWLRPTVIMTDCDVLTRFHAIVGGVGTLNGPLQRKTRPDHKPYWIWRAAAQGDAVMVMDLLAPWLGARRTARLNEGRELCRLPSSGSAAGIKPALDQEAAWSAGLFEGEGCITTDTRGMPRLQLSSTDRDAVDRFRAGVLGAGNISGPGGHSKSRPMWTWRTGRRSHVLAVMDVIGPWLGERRRARWAEVRAAYSV